MKLERQLGLTSVIAISMSTMLGSGIFVLPGLAAAKTGPSVWLAYLVAGLCVIPAGLSKAELATAMPTSGGTYIYLDRAFGPMVGTIAGIGLWLSLLLKAAFALVGFAAYLYVLAAVPLKPVALVFLLAVVGLNIVGIIRVSQVQLVLVGLALAGLAALSILGAFSYDGARLADPFTEGTGGFFAAVAFVFVSYAGVTKVAAIAEEVRNPSRNLPIGILLSLGLVMAVYAVVCLVLAGNVPLDELESDLHPIYTLADTLGGRVVGIAFAVLGVLTMTSMANAGLLAAARFPFAMSRDELLPEPLRRLHPRFLTPTVSIFASGAFMAAAILLFDVERIAKVASAFVIMLYLAENLAVIVLRETGVRWYKPSFRSPLYPGIQVFGVLSGLGLLAMLGPVAVAASAAIALPGALLFALYGRRRTDRRGVVRQRGRRRELLSAGESSPALGAGDSSVRIAEDVPVEESEALVALLGAERSPELLVELGAALCESKRLEVALLTELPEQTALDAVEQDPRSESIRRRVHAVADAHEQDLKFWTGASHDIIRTTHELTSRVHCEWLIMEWAGRSRHSLTFRNPLGWLKDNLSCNLAVFHDAGVRYIRKILVYVEPGPHDALVVRTAERLAAVHGADLTFARFVPDEAPATSAQAAADYLDQIHHLAQAASQVLLVRGDNEERAIGEVSSSYDLLVTAEAPQPSLFARLRGSGRDRLTAAAACSVLRLQTPRRRTHEALRRRRVGTAPPVPVDASSLLEPSCVRARVTPRRKDALFREFASVFAQALPELEVEELVEALWARERTQNTAVGHGVALPHATIPSVARSYLGVLTTPAPIDYEAPDGERVDVFFVTLGPPADRNTHLLLLADISRLVLHTPLLERLRAAEEPEEMLAAFRECAERNPSA